VLLEARFFHSLSILVQGTSEIPTVVLAAQGCCVRQGPFVGSDISPKQVENSSFKVEREKKETFLRGVDFVS